MVVVGGSGEPRWEWVVTAGGDSASELCSNRLFDITPFRASILGGAGPSGWPHQGSIRGQGSPSRQPMRCGKYSEQRQCSTSPQAFISSCSAFARLSQLRELVGHVELCRRCLRRLWVLVSVRHCLESASGHGVVVLCSLCLHGGCGGLHWDGAD